MYTQILPAVHYRFLNHAGSIKSTFQRSSSSSESSCISGSISFKVRCRQTPSQNGRLLGCLEVKGEIGLWVVVNSAGSKEALVVKTK